MKRIFYSKPQPEVFYALLFCFVVNAQLHCNSLELNNQRDGWVSANIHWYGICPDEPAVSLSGQKQEGRYAERWVVDENSTAAERYAGRGGHWVHDIDQSRYKQGLLTCDHYLVSVDNGKYKFEANASTHPVVYIYDYRVTDKDPETYKRDFYAKDKEIADQEKAVQEKTAKEKSK